jgi:hypothetical protein
MDRPAVAAVSRSPLAQCGLPLAEAREPVFFYFFCLKIHEPARSHLESKAALARARAAQPSMADGDDDVWELEHFIPGCPIDGVDKEMGSDPATNVAVVARLFAERWAPASRCPRARRAPRSR